MKKFITYLLLTLMLLTTILFLIHNHQEVASIYVSAASVYFVWIGISLAVYLVFLIRRTYFIENMIHELTHLIFALGCFRRINGFHVTSSRGVVYTEAGRFNMVITLSPYFFPLITVMMMLLFSFLPVRLSQPLVMISYVLFVVVTVKSIIEAPDEIRSTGVKGWFLLLIMTFWMSFLVFTWSLYPGVQFIEFLKSLCYEFIGTC